MLINVTIKLIEPAKEDTPATCKLKIAKSTAGLGCPVKLLKGGYTVQPVPAPPSTIEDNNNKDKDGGNNQKLILYRDKKSIIFENLTASD
jgi:hypothetical protein